jgi:hypothetical protein
MLQFIISNCKFHNLFMLLCYCCFMNMLQINLAMFYSNLSLWFLITMSETKRKKTSSVWEKMNILPQVDAERKHVAQAASLWTAA